MSVARRVLNHSRRFLFSRNTDEPTSALLRILQILMDQLNIASSRYNSSSHASHCSKSEFRMIHFAISTFFCLLLEIYYDSRSIQDNDFRMVDLLSRYKNEHQPLCFSSEHCIHTVEVSIISTERLIYSSESQSFPVLILFSKYPL